MKVVILGPDTHIFSQVLLEKLGKTVSFCELSQNIPASAPRIVAINQIDKEVLAIAKGHPKAKVFLCRGGEKDFQPNLTLVKPDGNSQSFLFQSWDEFAEIILNPPIDLKPLVSVAREADRYHFNYQNFSELIKRQRTEIDKDFFWFSVFFSKLYLWWYRGWLEGVKEELFPIDLKLKGKGKVKRIAIPFVNIYRGEMIFREGETIQFFRRLSAKAKREEERNSRRPYRYEDEEDYLDVAAKEKFLNKGVENKPSLIGNILTADEDGLEIVFSKSVEKNQLSRLGAVAKDRSILAATIEAYTSSCNGYADLSRKDYIYGQSDHYDRPEDFLRGYIPNHNVLHLPIVDMKLEGKAKAILRDKSQLQALMDIFGPSFVSLVEGPPGTGKTLVTAIAIKELVDRGQVVLVTSHSNQGLDNLLSTMMDYVDSKAIFRLGNNADLVSSENVKKLHRSVRYESQCLKAEENYRQENRALVEEQEANGKVVDHREKFAVFFENQDIWGKVCANKGMVIATTVNSFQFDHQLFYLNMQNNLISNTDFQNLSEGITKFDVDKETDSWIPTAVVNHLRGNAKIIKPRFLIDTTVVDEATKARFPELVPILKGTETKLVLVGDTDQLGNITFSPEMAKDILAKAMSFCININGDNITIFPDELGERGDHALSPLNTTVTKLKYWLEQFSSGIFHSIVEAGRIESNHLSVNRRSLREITELLNFVFDKDLKVGRFNPHVSGSVTLLDVDSQEERFKTSYRNRQEKSLVVREVLKYFGRQKKLTGAINLSSLGVIATYRGQIKLIKERLRKELLFHPLFAGLVNPENIDQVLKNMVNTVDAFQGSERRAIIISLVRANVEGKIGFTENLRRIYVALSRTQDELIIITNTTTFLNSQSHKVAQAFGRIVEFTKAHKRYGRK